MDFLSLQHLYSFGYKLSYWHWISIGALLLIAEIAVNSGFLWWIGLSAFMMSIIVWLNPAFYWGVQLLLFSAGAIIACILWRLYVKHYPDKTDNPYLNSRCEQYINRAFELIEPLHNGRGKIRADGIIWTVAGPDLPASTTVKITGVTGAILIAEKFSGK